MWNQDDTWYHPGMIEQRRCVSPRKRSGNAENLCRTQVEIQLNEGAHVSDLLHRPLGSHLVMVTGHHNQRLRDWWGTYIANEA